MEEGLGCAILIVCAIVLIVGAYIGGEDAGYKAGQIDALQGTIKYELVTHPDSTRTWEPITTP